MELFPNYLHFSKDINQSIKNTIENLKPDKVAILTDENTIKFCLPKLSMAHDFLSIRVNSGENEKNLTTCTLLWNELTKGEFTRKSLLINLGGGVICDMGGFVAATFKRGIPFVHIPTTLLSQVDASIGGKLGIDYNGLKNHLGVFKEPDAVLISESFLETLPETEILSGFAEIIKHALIADQIFWGNIKEIRTLALTKWEKTIQHSVAIKEKIVSQDPKESGLRKILNYGHTIGHALESVFLANHNPMTHGEAIALGMLIENQISVNKEILSSQESCEIEDFVLSHFNIPDSMPDVDSLLPYIVQDKKNDGRQVKMSCINRIGHCLFDVTIEPKEIRHAYLQCLSNWK